MPQASVALNVLVCARLHPVLCTGPSLDTIVGALHASVADAFPSATLMTAAVGLQPNIVDVPITVSAGGVRSLIQVTVLDAVKKLPVLSITVNVLVCEREQPEL